jgi:hypothetical protein
MFRIPRNRGIDVIDHIADIHGRHSILPHRI